MNVNFTSSKTACYQHSQLSPTLLDHQKHKTVWNDSAAREYKVQRHGPDGAKFLDQTLTDKIKAYAFSSYCVGDIGCGTAYWSLECIKYGATHVKAVDVNPSMIRCAEKNLEEHSEAVSKVDLSEENALNLSWEDNTCDFALSINVGCNIDELQNHLTEMVRVTKNGGTCLVTAPDNFDTVFTDDSLNDEDLTIKLDQLDQQLSSIDPECSDRAEQVKTILKDESYIYRATIAKNPNNQYQIIRSKEQLDALKDGVEIYRKLPGMVVPNYYHSFEDYQNNVKAIQEVDQTSITVLKESFATEQEQAEYNTSANKSERLGKEYINRNPFGVLLFSKKN